MKNYGRYSTGKIETKIEVAERQRRRREQILVEFKEISNWKLKQYNSCWGEFALENAMNLLS